MNNILIPYLKEIFVLKYWQAMLIQFCFFGAYFIGSLIYYLLSLRIGDPINKVGYKNGIIIVLVVSGIGCLMFFPAAQFKIYGFFLGALFVLGLGFTMLQIAANPYVAILGAALIPLIQGVIADILGLQTSFIVPLICYVYIIFYGIYSSRWKLKNNEIQPLK